MSRNKVRKNKSTPNLPPGRPKGSLNKKTEHFFDLCAEHEFDPVELLILIGKNDWKSLGYESAEIQRMGVGGQVAFEERISIKDRESAAKDLLTFMYPKRKAIEVSSEDKDSGFFKLAYDSEKLKKKLDE